MREICALKCANGELCDHPELLVVYVLLNPESKRTIQSHTSKLVLSFQTTCHDHSSSKVAKRLTAAIIPLSLTKRRQCYKIFWNNSQRSMDRVTPATDS